MTVNRAEEFCEQIIKPPVWAQVLNVVGEAGELAEAFRRHSGHARRYSDAEEVLMELADVVISAQCLAYLLGQDIDEIVERKWGIIFRRGFGHQDRHNAKV